ncbi:hypothetical protein CNMCM8714_007345 [Aspergillus fumigatus]|nr:hypothetical protein CNMCM8714_007345 [Aspergillus fumigatus]
MGEKRKLELDELTIPSKSRKRPALDDADPIYEEPQSDADYVSSDESSVNSDSLHETPATPISTTSAKYPSELKTHRSHTLGSETTYATVLAAGRAS